MKITDEQVATLRAQLAGERREHERRLEQLTTEEEKAAYGALVTAALFEAIDRRFIKDGRAAEDDVVINFIAHQRAIHPNSADLLDPTVVENVILNALNKAPLGDFDGETSSVRRFSCLRR